MSFDKLDNVLINLKVLSKVESCGRIQASQECIILDKKTPQQPILRWIRGDTRVDCIKKIKDIIECAVKHAKLATDEKLSLIHI